MNIDPALAWLEATALSQWVTGSPSMLAFPGILTLHAIGMGFAVGISAILDLRVLGVAPRVPLSEIRRFLPFLWLGFWVNVASGVLLVIGYPTKALTNPVFYLKLLFIAAGMVLLMRIGAIAFAGAGRLAAGRPGAGRARAAAGAAAGHAGDLAGTAEAEFDVATDAATTRRLRRMAIVSLLCWTGAITAGRLLAYTYTRLHVLP